MKEHIITSPIKIKIKFLELNNRDKLIVCSAVSIVIMLIIGVIFKVIGFDSFIIDDKVNIEYDGICTRLLNAVMFWINFYFFLALSLENYTFTILPKWIFSFPIIYFSSYCNVLNGYLVTFGLPFVLIFLVKFNWRIVKRTGFLLIIISAYQLISMFVKTNVFSLIPINNASNIIQSFIYSIDLYIFLIIILLMERNEVLK